jgi:hypothetical protein
MDIKILEFKLDQKNNRVGFVDFIITYSEEKTETFRNVAYFKKVNADGNTTNWLNLPVVIRNEKLMPVYERTPSIKPLMDKVLKLLKTYINDLN